MIALLHGAEAFGAVERYVEAIVEGLRERGTPVTLHHPDVPTLAPFARLAGGSVVVQPYPGDLLRSPVAVRELARRVRGADVVHVTDVWPVAQVAGRLAGARVIVTHHTPELRRRFSFVGRLWWRFGWLVRPEVVYTSEIDRQNDGRSLLRSHVVPLGIDLGRFLAVERNAEAGPVVGTVARLAEQKGLRYLLEAVPLVRDRHPDVRFVLVGDGEERAALERLADGNVTFAGHQDDVPRVLAGFDVFAFPSLFEGLCLAVIEAQAAGVPVVATPVGGIRETVRDGETGLLCRPRDARSLADGIVRLLDDPRLARRVADEARRRSAQYSVERMVAGTLALYA
jgi:glycosyltransferase involved in cell wall biosynthesis